MLNGGGYTYSDDVAKLEKMCIGADAGIVTTVRPDGSANASTGPGAGVATTVRPDGSADASTGANTKKGKTGTVVAVVLVVLVLLAAGLGFAGYRHMSTDGGGSMAMGVENPTYDHFSNTPPGNSPATEA